MKVLPVKMQEAKESGNPFFIELYYLRLRDGAMRIAACDESILFNNEEYTAVPFQRGEITSSMDNLTDECEVTLGDCSYELLSYVMNGFDFRGCSAVVFRILYPDSLKDPTNLQLVFSGFIDEPSYSDGQFTCKIKSRLPEIECPNRKFRLACNSDFGDAECCMSLAKETLPVSRVGNTEIDIGKSYPTNYWKDGVITVGGESRLIEHSTGSSVFVNVNFVQDIIGKSAELQRGCNKTVARCKEYNNMRHFSGFPAIPFESIYQ